MPRTAKPRYAVCHPGRVPHGHGLCWDCYYIKHRSTIINTAKEHYANNRERRKQAIYEAHLIRMYGITIDDYTKMLTKQKGVCFLCGKPPNGKKFKRLHVDHDHKTGEVRGLLCRGCNGLLGWYEAHKEQLKLYLKG